jgi:putative polyhydroxyalkanoate system protein
VSNIHIDRPHQLGLEAARKIAFAWAEKAERKFDMECLYSEGKEGDTLTFQRSGVQGTLEVLPERFELRARLGLLMSAFKERIADELNAQFDALLAPPAAKKAKSKAPALEAEERPKAKPSKASASTKPAKAKSAKT